MRLCLKAFQALTKKDNSKDNSQEWIFQFQSCLSAYMSIQPFSSEECELFYTTTHRMMCLPIAYDAYARILEMSKLKGAALSQFYLAAARSYYARSQQCTVEMYPMTAERLWAYANLAYCLDASVAPEEECQQWSVASQIAHWLTHWPAIWEADWLPENVSASEDWLTECQQRLARAFELLKMPFHLAEVLPNCSEAVQQNYRVLIDRSSKQLLIFLQSLLNAAMGVPQCYPAILEQTLRYAKHLATLGHVVEAERWIQTLIQVQTDNFSRLQTLSLPDLSEIQETLKTEAVLPLPYTPARDWQQRLLRARQDLKKSSAEDFVVAQKTYTASLQALFSEIAAWTTTMLGLPPAPFSVLGFGSISRGDMVIYSDIECALLIDESIPTTSTHPYYPAWIAFLKATLFTLGEPCILDKDMIPLGFHLDSDLSFTTIAWTIQSPHRLATWVIDVLMQPAEMKEQGHDYRIHASALLQAVPLYQSHRDLFQQYHVALAEKLTPKVREEIARTLWQYNEQQFARQYTLFKEAQSDSKRPLNLKNMYLKPLSLMTQVWAFLAQYPQSHPIEVLEYLREKHGAPDWVSEAISSWIEVQRWRIRIETFQTPDTLIRAHLSIPERKKLDALNSFLERIIQHYHHSRALAGDLQSEATFRPIFAEATAEEIVARLKSANNLFEQMNNSSASIHSASQNSLLNESLKIYALPSAGGIVAGFVGNLINKRRSLLFEFDKLCDISDMLVAGVEFENYPKYKASYNGNILLGSVVGGVVLGCFAYLGYSKLNSKKTHLKSNQKPKFEH